MTNPARNFRERAQSTWPGAIVVERGRNHIVHQHPTDSSRKMVDTDIGPLHISGTQTEIDTAWVATAGAWQYQMITADFYAYSRNQMGVGTMYRYQHPQSGEYVEFQPLALNWVNDLNSRQQIIQPQSVMGVVTDDIIRFPNGYGTGRHFEYQVQSSRFRKLLTIDGLSNLPIVTVTGTPYLEIEFILSHSSGVTWFVDGAIWNRSTRIITSNQIEARDSGGNVLWLLDYPKAWDSAGNEITGQIVMRRQGANRYVTVRIPKIWIDAAVFPIFIDPTINPATSASTDDASEDGDGDVTVADVGLLVGATIATLHRYTMQRFFVTIPNNATIDASYVQWYFFDAGTDDASCVIYGEDSATPAAGSAGTDTYSIRDRTHTTASVQWDQDDIMGGATGYGNSPSLNSIIGELTSSYDYSSGRYLALLTDIYGQSGAHNSTIRSYDGNSSQSPILHIEYTESSSGVNGSLVRTLGNITSSAAGDVLISPVLNKSLDVITINSIGTIEIKGSESSALADVSLSSIGSISANLTGQLSITLSESILNATGNINITGNFTQTSSNITLNSIGNIDAIGNLTVALLNIALSSTSNLNVIGNSITTLSNIFLTAISDIDVSGNLTTILSNMVSNSTGNVYDISMVYPISDILIGNWTTQAGATTGLYDTVNETSFNDSDYMRSELSPIFSPVVLAFGTAPDGGLDYAHTLNYRIGKLPSDTNETVDLTIELRQDYTDELSQGTLIASWLETDLSTTFATIEQILTSEQINAISDYGSLFIRFVAEVA